MLEQELYQQMSEEQNYWETIRGIWLFMVWQQEPEFECSASSQDDHPFASPSDDWLSQTRERLNLSFTEGYPTCSTGTSGLSKDQFINVPHTQKWYNVGIGQYLKCVD